MKPILLTCCAAVLLGSLGLASEAWAGGGRFRAGQGCCDGAAWHGNYYHAAWGAPVALVVPPRATLQTHWGWGVGNTRVTGIYPQFRRNFPGPVAYDRNRFAPTPAWPADTDQFGVYYVRAPW